MLRGFAYPQGTSRCGFKSTTDDKTRPERAPRTDSVRIDATHRIAPPVLAASRPAASSASGMVDQKRVTSPRSMIAVQAIYVEDTTYYVTSILFFVYLYTYYAQNMCFLDLRTYSGIRE